MTDAEQARITAMLRVDARPMVEAMQSIEHAFQRATVSASQAARPLMILAGGTMITPLTRQERAEAKQRLVERQAQQRFDLLRRHGRNVIVVTGPDGISRVVNRG